MAGCRWALGVMICEMVAGVGKTPFGGEDVVEDTEVATYRLDRGYTVPYLQRHCCIQVFRNILQEEPKLPPRSSTRLQQLLKGLLCKEVPDRLGSEGQGGTEGLMQHEWFASVPWDQMNSEAAGTQRGSVVLRCCCCRLFTIDTESR